MASHHDFSYADLSNPSAAQSRNQGRLPLRIQQIDQIPPSRNPFDSPNLSTSSFNGTDSGSTSGQDEFHLERYSSSAGHKHTRQTSRSTASDDKQRPDLNIITSFTTPNMPMNSNAVRINEVQAKCVSDDRRLKGLSVVSHKAVESAVSLPEQHPALPSQSLGLRTKQLGSKKSKRSKPIQRLQNAIAQRQMSPLTQRIPIGITIPREHAATVDPNADSALPCVTPMTPAIVVTPAGEQRSWVLQRRGTSEKESASDTYSALSWDKSRCNTNMPYTPRTAELDSVYTNEKLGNVGLRTSLESSEMILPNSSDSARPKSQGWWNVMLSPLLRAGSLASKRGQQPNDTPPVPPLPMPTEKDDSPAVSARSDPSFLVSPHDTDPSPDTPRRQGLASARGSTWSRWTEWECEREAGINGTQPDTGNLQDLDMAVKEGMTPAVGYSTGLAAEYFHACAIEQLTGRPYFECINHDCGEQLPKLHSIHDFDRTKALVLGSPFDESRAPNLEAGIKTPDSNSFAKSPSILNDDLSPNELSPNVRQASVAPVVKARALDSSSDRASETKECDVLAQDTQDKAVPPLIPPTYSAPRGNNDLPNIETVTQQEAPAPQVVEIKITREASQPLALSGTVYEKRAPVSDQSPAIAASNPEPLSGKGKMHSEHLASPAPITPDGQKFLAPVDAAPLTAIEHSRGQAPVVLNNYSSQGHLPGRPTFITAETEYPQLPERIPTAPVTARDLASESHRLSIEEHRQRLEKEDATAKRVGGLWRGRGCFSNNGCMGRGGRESRTKRRWIVGISFALLVIIIGSIVLAVTLTRHGDGTPVESQWLNLTGFPAMPTGILTIASPKLAAQEKQCISPSTMWSCAVPKEDQDEIGDNEPDRPNFRFEIKFRNGTVPANMTLPMSSLSKRANDPFTNELFVPNPAPPNQADQVFLGNTTDNVTAPFDGEKTPFYITFMPAFPTVPEGFNGSTKRLERRQSNSSLLDAIPAPDLAEDGSAAPASLLPTTPYPISQPVRLYNRGLQDEHYGFYMYYDKSIYLSGLRLDGNGVADGSTGPANADQDGGSAKMAAAARCTFAQTRFLFKIFTNAAFDGALLPFSQGVNSTNPDDQESQRKTSSATDFEQPGSFPYPASIVLDRHGGNIDSKAAWCYGMANGDIVKDQKILVGEKRAFGGEPINASPSLSGDAAGFNRTAGGIDGGTGGCGCTWQNWE